MLQPVFWTTHLSFRELEDGQQTPRGYSVGPQGGKGEVIAPMIAVRFDWTWASPLLRPMKNLSHRGR